MTIKKTRIYDKVFHTMGQTEVNKLKELIQDPQFEMDLMTLFN